MRLPDNYAKENRNETLSFLPSRKPGRRRFLRQLRRVIECANSSGATAGCHSGTNPGTASDTPAYASRGYAGWIQVLFVRHDERSRFALL